MDARDLDMLKKPKQPSVAKDTNVPTNDCISRQAAIDVLHGYFDGMLETDTWSPCDVYGLIEAQPSAQPDLSEAYAKAVWTWLIDYQIKAAELKGRYTPYEVLSWVANDWRKDHERSD